MPASIQAEPNAEPVEINPVGPVKEKLQSPVEDDVDNEGDAAQKNGETEEESLNAQNEEKSAENEVTEESEESSANPTPLPAQAAIQHHFLLFTNSNFS